MAELVPAIHALLGAFKKGVDAGTIGERSDAVLRTAMASVATPSFGRLWPGMTWRDCADF
jgi:hypothetical protein